MGNPEFYQASFYDAQFPTEKRISVDGKSNDHFVIDDLLDFPNDDGAAEGDASAAAAFTAETSLAAAAPAAEGYFQAADVGGAHFTNELCVAYDDLAELEWLSNFADESFSSEDLQKLQLIQGIKARTNEIPQAHQYQFQPETKHSGQTRLTNMSVPAKARSKRSRAAPGNWSSRLLMMSPPATPAMSSSSESDMAATVKKPSAKPAAHRKKEAAAAESSAGGEVRKCLHCATDKTPQWRTGPNGPKTLCNACGVRYKSGRLVPEYRPAASPTFVLTKHSNSHRKVLELRRQKEMVRSQQQFMHHHHHHHPTTMMFDVSPNGDDYLIHQHIGPDFRQLIHD